MQEEFRIDLSPTVSAYAHSDALVNIIYSGRGEGKCLHPDTEVILFSGSLKAAKDVVPGDQLMGDDSTPRNVLSVCTGIDDMYEVVPVKGESFICNKEHILVLDGKNKFPYKDEICISVKDYIGKESQYFESGHCPLIRRGIKFGHRDVEIEPYFVGLWLADGDNNKVAITTPDEEIVSYLYEFASKWETGITVYEEPSKANHYHLSNGNVGHTHKVPSQKTKLRRTFKKLNLFNNKHIPDIYKHNSVEIRRLLLAGLLDGDGFLNHGGYDLVTKYKELADDVIYLCRSLELAAYVKKCRKGIKKTGFVGRYYRIHISGDCSSIPALLERRKAPTRKQVKRVTVTGIKEIKYLGKGKYCGFTLDGNHKFLLGSFIVSHNTVGSIAAMLIHAKRNKKPIRAAILRDTHENIKKSTARSIEDTLPIDLYRFKDDYKELTIFSEPQIKCDLFGIDDGASLSKLQGAEYSLIWLEEPAPMSDRANAGLSEDVFNAALIAATRQTKTIPRLQVSMNPADQDHWTYKRFFEDPLVDPENPLVVRRVFSVPYGENKYLPEISRQATKVAYRHDKNSYMRYVENKFVPLHRGKSVTSDYGSGNYLTSAPVIPAAGLEGFRGYDGWHNPVMLIGQITHSGRLIFIDTIIGQNCDIGILIKNKGLPLLNSPRWKGKCKSWRDIGDISMKTPDQSNITTSASKVVEELFDTYFEGGPARWVNMKRGISNALSSNILGEPAFMVSSDNRLLDKALSGGWHYKVDNAGNIVGDIPEKNESCVDEKTQILTYGGWKNYNELSIGDSIYGYDLSKKTLVYDNLLAINRYNSKKYDVLHFKSSQIDMVVTPNHKCLVQRKISKRIRNEDGSFKCSKSTWGDLKLVEAKELHSGHRMLCIPNQRNKRSLNGSIAKATVVEEERSFVWCPTTTTGTWIARRNGQVFVTGNSHVGDAWANVVNVLLPMQQRSTNRAKLQTLRRKARRRAAGYAT